MTLIKTKTFLFCLKDAESIQQHSVVRISCAWFYLFIICLSDLSSTGFEIDQTSRSDIGPLHVLWQVSFGCWVTWSISSWQKYYKSVFFPKVVMGSRASFSVFQQLRPKLTAKWMLSILSDLFLIRKTEKNVYFSILQIVEW